MTSWQYTRDDLIGAIRAVGIEAGDTVSLQVSLGRLGLPQGIAADYPALSNFVIDAFLEVLGAEGTLIVPTYSYSIGRGEVFEVERTPATIGEFPEVFRKRTGVLRSRDPMLSSAGIGPQAAEVLRNISRSCYGAGSTYHRLRDVDAKVCTLGISLYWATFRHHIEEMAEVPFRFRKLFQGIVRENGRDSRESWVYFAAPYAECCEPVGLPLEKLARSAGLVRCAAVGRGEIMAIGACEYFDFGQIELKKNPWLTAKGPACSIGELVRLEDERVGTPSIAIDPVADATMEQVIDAVWALPRDLVSAGYDAALDVVARQVPMTVHKYASGTECWSWIVPEKWVCRSARLETIDGRVIFSTDNSLFHVASYSKAFNGEIDRDELFKNLHVHPVLPDVTPYHYLFYKQDWGLCCSQHVKATLTEDRYRVVIDAAFSYGELKVGEVIVPGESEHCIVICAHLDHRGQVNDGLSGVAVGIEVMRELMRRDRLNFTYRLLIVPETIGSAAYLSHNEHLIPSMRGGAFLDMVGLDNPLTLQHSASPDSAFDRVCLAVLKTREPEHRTGRFLEVVTNDDRQFNAPGIRVPMVSLSRVRQPCGRRGAWLYDEYHSERDDPALNSVERLMGSRDTLLAILDAWEANYVPMPLFRGEVFLSRFGIYYDYEVDPDYGQALFEVMHALDGERSIADIALDTERPFDTVLHIVEQFRAAGLVKRAEPEAGGALP